MADFHDQAKDWQEKYKRGDQRYGQLYCGHGLVLLTVPVDVEGSESIALVDAGALHIKVVSTTSRGSDVSILVRQEGNCIQWTHPNPQHNGCVNVAGSIGARQIRDPFFNELNQITQFVVSASGIATTIAGSSDNGPGVPDARSTFRVQTSSAGTHGSNPSVASANSPVIAPVPIPGICILSLATEWKSRHGGLSTFNRDLCCALARSGARVVCYVPHEDEEEVRRVRDETGVEIVVATDAPGLNDVSLLLQRPKLPVGFIPTVVIGHDRITGAASASLCRDHYPASKHLLFIHTNPKQIEWFKEQGDGNTATGNAEHRRQLQIRLAEKAHLVVGVGPKLYQAISNDLHAHIPPKTTLEFLPGFETSFRVASPPPANECFVLGRAEDADLKGLDIAARAMAKLLAAPHQAITPPPVLVIRGAPIGTGDDLKKELMQKTNLGANYLYVREYSSDVNVIQRDILSSALVLLPSRTEGFGLAAFEAIALGIPVLISDQSGLAEMLRTLVPEHAKMCVVHVSADSETDATLWERQIEFVLRDKPAAFARADALRNELVPHLSWQKSVHSLLKAIAAP